MKSQFAWGISTSAFQYEDPAVKPGDADWFETDWDVGLIKHGRAPARGRAEFSWSHWERDIEALKKIGVTHYRFGVEWARVEPRPGQYNMNALKRYISILKALKAAKIEPIVCLWHFTFPAWLYDDRHPHRSNWLHPQARSRWQAYLEMLVPKIAPYVRTYAPQNEPNGQLSTAYLAGLWPPAKHLSFSMYRKALDASASLYLDAATIVRSIKKNAQILSIHALPWWEHGLPLMSNFIFEETRRNSYEHLDRVAAATDIIGINYYYSQPASIAGFVTLSTHRGPHYSMMGWRISPDGLYQQIKFVGERYRKPMMITENGVATPADTKRVRYMKDHIGATRRAIAEGSDVRGYFAWSLADNYEWHYGYKAKFGLSHVNPRTFERELRPSAHYFRDVIRGLA